MFTPTSSGRPYEVLVVMDKNTWEAPTGRALYNVLDTDVPGLPQSERSFRISQIPLDRLQRSFKIFRNIIIADIQPGYYTQPKLKFTRNAYASPQMILTIQAPNEESFAEFVEKNGQTIIDFFESIGIVILNGYGITECAPLISCNRNEYRKKGSVGLPIIGGHVKILDPDENGEGEISYKGPNVMMGYYKNEEATREVFTEEGYFRTGDYGKVEMEGDDQWIYITGRLKNLIIFSNGKNVYPEEIETDIQGVYGVGEVVVYAGESKSDPSKEVIVAEIYPDAEELEKRGITDTRAYFTEEIRKINARMAPYKAVSHIKLRSEEFVKNTSRKILRFSLDKSVD